MKDNNGVTELYRVHRPTLFKSVLGQEEAIATIQALLKAKRFPHALMLSGPSGCGKTTIARVLQTKLNCAENDFFEINAAESRGIDTIREIQLRMGMAPRGGSCRIYLLDEGHKLSGDAQSALLKTLEDTPRHVYLIICTTDPNKLLKTIHTRCTQVRLQPLKSEHLISVLQEVATKENIELSEDLVNRIVECSDGSARKALVLLGQVRDLDGDEAKLNAVLKSDLKDKAFTLTKKILWSRDSWSDIANLLKEMEGEDVEGLRRLLLKCASSEVLKGGKGAERAANMIRVFAYDTFASGFPGLIGMVYEVCSQRK